MREFFRGWRRKVGCVTLVLACVFAGMWVRSLAVMDTAAFPRPNRQHIVESVNGRIWWTAYFQEPEWEFSSMTEHKEYPQGYVELILPRKMIADAEGSRFRQWAIPYWSATIPLTILSAYLLLWPCKRVAKQAANSEGA